MRRLGKISQRDVSATLSSVFRRVVFFIPTAFEENRFMTARSRPERINASIRSIMKEYPCSKNVLPWSGLKNLKKIALYGGFRWLSPKTSASIVPNNMSKNQPNARLICIYPSRGFVFSIFLCIRLSRNISLRLWPKALPKNPRWSLSLSGLESSLNQITLLVTA